MGIGADAGGGRGGGADERRSRNVGGYVGAAAERRADAHAVRHPADAHSGSRPVHPALGSSEPRTGGDANARPARHAAPGAPADADDQPDPAFDPSATRERERRGNSTAHAVASRHAYPHADRDAGAGSGRDPIPRRHCHAARHPVTGSHAAAGARAVRAGRAR